MRGDPIANGGATAGVEGYERCSLRCVFNKTIESNIVPSKIFLRIAMNFKNLVITSGNLRQAKLSKKATTQK